MTGVGETLPVAAFPAAMQRRQELTAQQSVGERRIATRGVSALVQAGAPVAGTGTQKGKGDVVELSSGRGPRPAPGAGKAQGSADGKELTPEEQRQVQELRKRDQEVRQHEAAHKAAAGQYAQGAAMFTYQIGPDGKRYAVGGEVKVDTSPIPGDPEATIRKMETIQRAALAPKDPSAADRATAAQAARTVAAERQELAQKKPAYFGESQTDTRRRAFEGATADVIGLTLNLLA